MQITYWSVIDLSQNDYAILFWNGKVACHLKPYIADLVSVKSYWFTQLEHSLLYELVICLSCSGHNSQLQPLWLFMIFLANKNDTFIRLPLLYDGSTMAIPLQQSSEGDFFLFFFQTGLPADLICCAGMRCHCTGVLTFNL